jgi:hypothetical protein
MHGAPANQRASARPQLDLRVKPLSIRDVPISKSPGQAFAMLPEASGRALDPPGRERRRRFTRDAPDAAIKMVVSP